MATSFRTTLLLIALCAIATTVGCVPADTPGLERDAPLPTFEATSLITGESVELSSYQGRTVLINLWATWCAPCRTEIPYLQQLHDQYRDQGFEVVGVSVDEPGSEAVIKAFLEDMGATYDILLDPRSRSEEVFLARGLPNSILVNREGHVEFSWHGPIEEGDPTFLRGLEAALNR